MAPSCHPILTGQFMCYRYGQFMCSLHVNRYSLPFQLCKHIIKVWIKSRSLKRTPALTAASASAAARPDAAFADPSTALRQRNQRRRKSTYPSSESSKPRAFPTLIPQDILSYQHLHTSPDLYDFFTGSAVFFTPTLCCSVVA